METKPPRFPDALVLIFAMIVLALVATWVLPTGEFTRVTIDGRARVVAGSFRAISAEALPWHAFLTRIPKGFERAGDVIFFVFIVGGVIGVVRASGAIDAVIGFALRKLGRRPLALVAGMVALLSVGAATVGMAEEYVPFVPVLATMCIALGLDALVAVAIVYVAAGIGYAAAPHNPFTVLIGQRIAGLELGSGAGFRWTLWAIAIVVGVHHIARYVRRIRRDPASSLVGDIDATGFEKPRDEPLNVRHGIVLAAFAAAIGLFVWGSAVRGWEFVELGALFLGVALLATCIAPLAPNHAAREFCKGAGEMTTTALLIGFAKTIQVVLEEGHVIDAVVNAIAEPLARCGPDLSAIGMLVVQSATNLLVPSGSAQAYVTMPLMTPLADLTGVSRQVAVLAYQCGDGLTNMIIPTNAVLMGVLAMGRVPYQRWVRFIAPLLIKLFVLFAAALIFANRTGF